MAIDERLDVPFVPGPPPVQGTDEDQLPRPVPPLHRMGREWLLTRRALLEVGRHGAIPATDVVSRLVRGGTADRHPAWRYLPPAGAPATRRDTPAAGPTAARGGRPGPRSMGVHPVLGRSLAPRTAELLGVLSACLDPAEGRTEGHAVRVAYLASRIAAELEMGDDARCHLLYAGLLHDAGSNGPAADDHEPADRDARRRRGFSRRPSPVPAASTGPGHLSRPDRATALVRLLGLPQGVLEAVASGEERWDGRGPRRERRTAAPPGARVVALAVVAAAAAAPPGATPTSIERALRAERGRALDPELVDAAIALGRKGLWGELGGVPLLERMLDLEPPHRVRHTDDAGLDRTAGAFADLVDTRTPFAGRHARRVADLAARTAAALGVEPRVASDIRRAALLHDIGRLVVPISILEKPDVLSPDERRVVDEHARTGAAVLERCRALGALAPLVAGHHERLDGSGRFPPLVDDDRELGARIIALSDRFEAMTADRPWRPALDPGQAWQELRDEATEPLAGVVLRIMERTVGDG